jgi:hypothetical protein
MGDNLIIEISVCERKLCGLDTGLLARFIKKKEKYRVYNPPSSVAQLRDLERSPRLFSVANSQ